LIILLTVTYVCGRLSLVGETATEREDVRREGPPSFPETWLTTAELAWVCGKTDRTIRNWVANGLIPCGRQPGGKIRFKFHAKNLLEWLPLAPVEVAPGATMRLVELMSLREVPGRILVTYVLSLPEKGSE
jgi:hypothetical protein